MKARDQAPRPINENAHSSGWTGGAVEAVVVADGRAGVPLEELLDLWAQTDWARWARRSTSADFRLSAFSRPLDFPRMFFPDSPSLRSSPWHPH